MTVAPDPVFPKASGGVMAEIGKEASCERGSGAEVVHTSAKDANRRDEIQEIPMTDTDVRGRLPAQPSTTDLNLWLVSRLKREGSELTLGQIASIAKDLSAALRSPGGDGELVDLLVSELDRARNQIARMDHDERCFTNDPNEDACCCICGKDSALTMIDDALERSALSAAEATKDAEDFKQWVAERQPDYKAAATSAPTPAPVSGERDWRALETAAWHLDQANKPALATLVRDAATALRTPHVAPGEEELVLLMRQNLSVAVSNYGLSADIEGIEDAARAILSRLTASREDGKNG